MRNLTTLADDYQRGISARDLAAWYELPTEVVRETVTPDVRRETVKPSNHRGQRSKLPPVEMLRMLKRSGLSQHEIARRFGVTQGRISQLIGQRQEASR